MSQDATLPIKFGTDGWRAVIARDFTFDNVRLCAQGVADYLRRHHPAGPGLIIGYDTRFASEDFAAAAAAVLAENGIKVYLCPEATPTPVISYGVVAHKLSGAIIITASHNPAIWNGFKYKTADGASAPPEVIGEIEANVHRVGASGTPVAPGDLAVALNRGLVEYRDLAPDYFAQMSRLVDLENLRKAGLRIVIDPMFGAGIGYLRKLLAGGNNELYEINAERNPLFPGLRPEPIAPNLGRLTEAIVRHNAAVGLATDGDADRVGIMDERGRFINQLQVFALLALYLLEIRQARGPIIKSLTTTSMVYRLGELYQVPVRETKVGFKYIAPLMMAENALIGGEESGGYGFRGHVPERDGILSSLYFLDFMVRTGKNPSRLLEYLFSKVGPHYYDRIDITFPAEQRQSILERVRGEHPATIDGVKVTAADTTDGFRFILADGSWLLIRFSGTEPVLRIYTETDQPERVTRILEAGRRMTGV
jgi:alpha-D-glucose phosphate-specific phosphoglucomutase